MEMELMGVAGFALGAALAGLAYAMKPESGRHNRLLLAIGAQVVLAALLAMFGFMAEAQAASCIGGLECIGPQIEAGIRAGLIWSGAIGLFLSALATGAVVAYGALRKPGAA